MSNKKLQFIEYTWKKQVEDLGLAKITATFDCTSYTWEVKATLIARLILNLSDISLKEMGHTPITLWQSFGNPISMEPIYEDLEESSAWFDGYLESIEDSYKHITGARVI